MLRVSLTCLAPARANCRLQAQHANCACSSATCIQTNTTHAHIPTPLVQVKVGAPFYSQAWHGLKYGSSNMGLLVSMGTTAAFAYSLVTMLLCALDASYMGHVYFESSVLILVFVCLGKYLESMAKARTSDAVRSLMQLAPKTAELVVFGGPDGKTERVQQIDTRLVQVRKRESAVAYTRWLGCDWRLWKVQGPYAGGALKNERISALTVCLRVSMPRLCVCVHAA